MKRTTQWMFTLFIITVAGVAVADPPQEVDTGAPPCKSDCKAQYRQRAVHCLQQTDTERDETQRQAFVACMEPWPRQHRACIEACGP